MIELINVRKTYGMKSLGLNNESIKLYDGQIVGILGENGSGKTTLLKAIMGLGEITDGSILIDGRNVQSQYDKMSFISEEGSYFPDMTPYEYGNFLGDFISSFDMDRYYKLLKFFDLEPHLKIKTFSNGQKSKLEISAGFSKGAKYILMDEPFSGKDIFTRRDFLKLMVSSLKNDETILITTHLIDEIENFLDRVVILRYGRIMLDIYTDDMRSTGRSLADVMIEICGYDEQKYKELLK